MGRGQGSEFGATGLATRPASGSTAGRIVPLRPDSFPSWDEDISDPFRLAVRQFHNPNPRLVELEAASAAASAAVDAARAADGDGDAGDAEARIKEAEATLAAARRAERVELRLQVLDGSTWDLPEGEQPATMFGDIAEKLEGEIEADKRLFQEDTTRPGVEQWAADHLDKRLTREVEYIYDGLCEWLEGEEPEAGGPPHPLGLSTDAVKGLILEVVLKAASDSEGLGAPVGATDSSLDEYDWAVRDRIATIESGLDRHVRTARPWVPVEDLLRLF
jgi:hypothetical protein